MVKRRQTLALGAAAAVLPAWRPAGAAATGEGPRVLRYAISAAETSFDPAQINDQSSRSITSHIFESLYVWDHLTRPPRIIPLVADGEPLVEDGFRRWTFKVRPGIHFADDAAFKGAKRELVAEPSKTLDVTLALATGGSSVGASEGSGASGGSTRTILSIGAIGLGVASLGVGTALGVVSLGKRSDADAAEIAARDPGCDSACRSQLAQQTEALDGDANLFGNLGIVGLGLGGALVATGVVLLLTDGEPEPPPSSAWVRPMLGPGFVGLEGGF